MRPGNNDAPLSEQNRKQLFCHTSLFSSTDRMAIFPPLITVVGKVIEQDRVTAAKTLCCVCHKLQQKTCKIPYYIV